ncbi:CubicO group peptidase (beta-lactamase class C family) [Myroides gitamensis]|uniref:serine hydrolase domain-containing protein n=1 Tax=Myroides odoratus TaxID=256 RepID=UPI002169F741|nr:serine hydrolase domain-containing protein [Myroides odoratus]MCS4238019.1 CubicO group peptidase (beta-lactamase class C family) [Myroides odoratus]MDH6600095.1 CubicO group peptidase (beta-lactamase class C family) [Myroides gitamensis]
MKNKIQVALAFLVLALAGGAVVLYQRWNAVADVTVTKQVENDKQPKKKEKSPSFIALSQLVDQYAANALQQGNINALAIAVYRDGEVYQQYYGALDSVTNQKPTPHTLYEIASISKVFLGSMVAKAVVEKKLNLQDDIRLYLPGDYANLQYEGTPITIKNLLTHTLGFQKKAPPKLDQIYQGVRKGDYQDKTFDYTMTDLLQELQTAKLNKKPGTVYEYNSVGPELMAYIMEQVYQKPYKEILQDFLDTLDLQHTYLYEYEKHKKDLAVSFDEEGKVAPWLKNPLLGGSHGMISTLPDLSTFMQFQLESNHPLIGESSRLLFKEEEEGDDKGYLWDVGYGQKEGAYHGKTGTSNGVQSGILICQDSNYGMIIIMNNTAEAAQEDWMNLYNQIETALIVYPKLN